MQDNEESVGRETGPARGKMAGWWVLAILVGIATAFMAGEIHHPTPQKPKFKCVPNRGGTAVWTVRVKSLSNNMLSLRGDIDADLTIAPATATVLKPWTIRHEIEIRMDGNLANAPYEAVFDKGLHMGSGSSLDVAWEVVAQYHFGLLVSEEIENRTGSRITGPSDWPFLKKPPPSSAPEE